MADCLRIYRAAFISDDALYRYALGRWWMGTHGRSVLGILLNPSTADAETDDPTSTRFINFVQSWNFYNSLTMANLFAFRATDPDKLGMLDATGSVGGENDLWLSYLISHDRIVCAWGAGSSRWSPVMKSRFAVRAAMVEAMIRQAGKMPMCWGWTKGGHPKHPLYLKSDTPLIALPVRGKGGRP
jgi:hypothetical protein